MILKAFQTVCNSPHVLSVAHHGISSHEKEAHQGIINGGVVARSQQSLTKSIVLTPTPCKPFLGGCLWCVGHRYGPIRLVIGKH
jgi:hypothetical protein